MRNSDKTISANSKGIVISYGDVNKHQFVNYNYVKKIQLEGTTKYQKIESELNPIQEEIYFKTVYGLSAYSENEIKTMSKGKKQSIIINYTKVQRLLNRWKQEIINESVNSLFSKLFPRSKTAKQITSVNGYDDDIKVTISFRKLGISEKKIASKLYEHHLLPKNFFNLA